MGLKVEKYATCEKDALVEVNCAVMHCSMWNYVVEGWITENCITGKRGESARENKTPGPAQLASGCSMAPGQTHLFQNAETNPTVNLFAFSSMS